MLVYALLVREARCRLRVTDWRSSPGIPLACPCTPQASGRTFGYLDGQPLRQALNYYMTRYVSCYMRILCNVIWHH
eukprot:201143-Pleurochrysis_carterae.AAC.1